MAITAGGDVQRWEELLRSYRRRMAAFAVDLIRDGRLRLGLSPPRRRACGPGWT